MNGVCVSVRSSGAQSRSILEFSEISSLLNPDATRGVMGLSLPGALWSSFRIDATVDSSVRVIVAEVARKRRALARCLTREDED